MELVTGKNTRGSVLGFLSTASAMLGLSGLSESFNGWDEARQERHAQRQAKKQARRPILTMRHISVEEHQFLTKKCAKANARRIRRAEEKQTAINKALTPPRDRRARGW